VAGASFAKPSIEFVQIHGGHRKREIFKDLAKDLLGSHIRRGENVDIFC
jgi:hypothetical protein